MVVKEISLEKFNKLKECQVFSFNKGLWMDGFRIVRVGKCYTTVAVAFSDGTVQIRYKNSQVRKIETK